MGGVIPRDATDASAVPKHPAPFFSRFKGTAPAAAPPQYYLKQDVIAYVIKQAVHTGGVRGMSSANDVPGIAQDLPRRVIRAIHSTRSCASGSEICFSALKLPPCERDLRESLRNPERLQKDFGSDEKSHAPPNYRPVIPPLFAPRACGSFLN